MKVQPDSQDLNNRSITAGNFDPYAIYLKIPYVKTNLEFKIWEIGKQSQKCWNSINLSRKQPKISPPTNAPTPPCTQISVPTTFPLPFPPLQPAPPTSPCRNNRRIHVA